MEIASTENVLHYIYVLYNNPDKVEKETASKWLEEFQKSILSWKVADQLLIEKHDLQSCCFAAQTMRNKIQNSFHELPDTAHESLRESLISHISHITHETKPVIVTQLCLALADLALLMSTWKKPVVSLLERFSRDANAMFAMVELLTLIPEEINSRYLRLGANRRKEILTELESNSGAVGEYLVACLMNCSDNENVQMKILKCLTSWIQINAFKLTELTDYMILAYAFQLLTNYQTKAELHDAATDCLCSLLHCLETANDVSGLEAKIFNGVLSLEDAYNVSVRHEDIDKSMNFCRLFTVLVESFLPKMIANSCGTTPHYTIKAFDLVLNCVGHYDFEVAEITFSMWYKLSEDLYSRNNDQLSSHFKPYVEKLIAALYKHCQIDPDHDGLIDEGDAFKDFRYKVSEIIKDVIFIISSISCFRQMFVILQAPNVTWEASEAALFIMENVARNIIPDENETVPKVVEAILNLPESCHIAIRYTSINILGELCDWIDCHPATLEQILNFLLHALQQKNGLATAAANALQSICSACKKHMVTQINGLLEIARCLDAFEIQPEAVIGLLKGISIIIGRLPKDQLTHVMMELCGLQIQTLNQLMENGPCKKVHIDPSHLMDRLAAIYRHVNPNISPTDINPCTYVIVNNWTTLSKSMDCYQHDGKIMERIVRCIRYALRCIGKQAMPILESLAKQIVHTYTNHQHSCLLYLGSILVDEFARDTQNNQLEETCVQGLLNMLQAFIEPTFHLLEKENGLKNHPDTVDDFFRLAARFIQRSPVEFLQSPLVNPIIQCGLLACTLDHRDANCSVMKFFCNLLSYGRPDKSDQMRAVVHQIILTNGETLVVNLIYSSVYYLHSYMLADVSDVLMELKLVHNSYFEVYIKKALENLPKTNSGGCVTATDEQLHEFVEKITRAETQRAMTLALQDFARLYR